MGEGVGRVQSLEPRGLGQVTKLSGSQFLIYRMGRPSLVHRDAERERGNERAIAV